jgi:hypothetical protein
MEPSVFLSLFSKGFRDDMEEFVPAFFSGTTSALKKGVTKMTADAAIKGHRTRSAQAVQACRHDDIAMSMRKTTAPQAAG